MTQKQFTVGIVGGTGYTGAELLRMLLKHPQVTVQAITSRKEAGLPVTEVFPHLRQHSNNLRFTTAEDGHLESCDVVFFATPHGVAMEQAPALLQKGVKVIDLGADFRLQNSQTFAHWYKMPHTQLDWLQQAVYGLPEIHRQALQKAQLVANPGCYPTTVLLGLLPLIEHGDRYMQLQPIIADCKSGVSGAGKKAEMGLLYAELSENFKAYGVAGHRHQPEITEQLEGLAQTNVELIFTPHLVPMIRGMFSTIYVRLTAEGQALDLQEWYSKRYQTEPFVEVLAADQLPETRFARGSNQLQISVRRTGKDSAIILVAQDNLVKGASGQAIQCMNLLLGLPETTGLTQIALLP